ncbi:MAG TPA: IclR family transcriptional regulator [Bryobacteraceae bacterium]|nr:IclR family transcriptional regulator [Bryobacteraceae bacterium]
MSDSETKASPYRVQVLDRAWAIIDTLAAGRGDNSLMELSEKLRLHKSTVHRLLMILERRRVVERDSQTGRYRLGLRLFELGAVAISRFNIRERALPHLERVLFEVDETVHLCVLDAGEVLYVEKIEPSRSVRMASRIGRRNGAHCSAVGKAMLAHLPERELDEILKQHGLPRVTQRTIVTPADLKADLKAVRERGYAIDNEESEEGLRCVGAVVLGHDGRPLGAISISAPSFRLPLEKVPAVAASVCRAARALSAESGYQGQWYPEVIEIPGVGRTVA